MFAAPHAAGHADAALHFIENQKDVVRVANFAQLLQPFAAEMVVAAFALDRLDNDRADVDLAPVDRVPYFLFAFFLALERIGLALRFGQREIDARAGDTGP